MTNEYKFFHEFFDGQITKPESEKFKTFKILLFSIVTAIGIFAVIMSYSDIIPLILLMMGMLWNVYAGLSRKISNVFSVIVAFLYFYVACRFSLYSHCLIYIACYIPFQQIANTKDYSEGDFVQVRKFITDANKLLLFILFAALAVALTLFDFAMAARFVYLDAISAALLVCSALLRNERYYEYYFFRFAGLIVSLVLWVVVALEYGPLNSLLVILMYISYTIYDAANYIYQRKTYTNQFLEKQKEVKRQQDKKLATEKKKIYEKMKNNK